MKENKYFCILPWLHLHVKPDANVYPCCDADYRKPFATLEEMPLADAWNAEEFKRLRLNMLRGEPSESCRSCYQVEESGMVSMRMNMNRNFARHFDLPKQTRPDGSLVDPKMKYLDIRFSNACNFKCRGCGHGLSSSWFDDNQKLYGPDPGATPVLRLRSKIPGFWADFEKILPQVERIYFGGGEPLFMEEHYEVLNWLIREKRTAVQLFYNTNLSKLQHNSLKLAELWKKFDHVIVQVSLDDVGDRAEYFRHGTKWEEVRSNLDVLKQTAPRVVLSVNWTANCFNAYYFPELVKFLLQSACIPLNHFHVNLMVHPAYYGVQMLPLTLKEKVRARILNLTAALEKLVPASEIQGFSSQARRFVDHMLARDDSHLIPQFKEITKKLDDIRNENFNATYPELEELHY